MNNISNAKNFGMLISSILVIYFFYEFLILNNFNVFLIIFACILFFLSKFFPKFLIPLSLLWIMIGVIGNKIISPIVIGLLFYFVVTPTSIIRLIFVKDPLNCKINKNKLTYWENADIDHQNYDNQF